MEISTVSPDTALPGLCALQQTAEYARALARLGATTRRSVVRDGNVHIGHVLAIRRRFGPLTVVWAPRGPVWMPDAGMDQRAEAMRLLPRASQERSFWVFAPDSAQDLQGLPYRNLVTPQHVAEIDLKRSPETRLAAQHGKWRNRLRHAQKSDLRVIHRPFDPERDSVVLRLETSQRETRRYQALPLAFLSAWQEANPKAARLFTVLQGTTPMAYMLVLLHAPAATYHIGWTGVEGRRNSAHNLALWAAQDWLARKGYHRFDLGSVDTQNAPGLARFKIGSGAHVRALGPTCLHLPRFAFAGRRRHVAA